MELPNVISGGVYRTPQKDTQKVPCRCLAFSISGLLHWQNHFPDGTPCPERFSGAFLDIGFPGFLTTFNYGADRENWVIMLDYPALDYDSRRHELYLDCNGRKIPLERCCRVTEEQIPEMRNRFRLMAELSHSALPGDNLKANLIAAELFTRVLPETVFEGGAAENLRRRLNEDRSWRNTIAAHCRKFGRPADVVRREFLQKFGMSPYDYRARLRQNDLLSMMTYSDLTFKEMADRLGLRHVQHLNFLVRKCFDCTPKELQKRFRKEEPFVESSPIHP